MTRATGEPGTAPGAGSADGDRRPGRAPAPTPHDAASADAPELDAAPEAGRDLAGEAFERGKRALGLPLGPTLAMLVWLLARGGPAPELPALMTLAVTWWLTEALPAAVVALLVAVAAVLTGLATPQVAFGAFGRPQLFLFVGSFFLAEAVRIHGLGERLAAAMMRFASTELTLLIAIGTTAFALSMVMSNSSATAILLPIALAAARGTPLRFQTALVLTVAWAASVGGLGTPVGTPPNLFGLAALRQQGVRLGFLEWMSFGVPIGAVMLAALLLVLSLLYGVRRHHQLPAPPRSSAAQPWSRGERSVVLAIAAALVGWLTPSVAQAVAPGSAASAWIDKHLTEELVAVVAGCALFVLPAGTRAARRPALVWAEATQIEWGVILLFGGGILMGDLAKSTGLSQAWGTALVELTAADTTLAITALCTAVAIALSELTSNTATATLMTPLAAELAAAAGAAPVPCVLGATLGASFGFMMPISTAPNALAYATGKVKMAQMIRGGIFVDVIGFCVIVLGLRVLCPLAGWW
jgi:solute carrier family 13 (sodium-dependent dicarboxylate transporter), member 2/3/5